MQSGHATVMQERRLFEGPRWTLRAVGGAAVLTLLVFVGLPYLETLAVRARPAMTAVPVEHRAVALPPPPLPMPPPEVQQEAVETPMPTLERPLPQPALPVASLDLTPRLEGVRPTFQTAFELHGGVDLVAQLKIFEIGEVDQPPVPLVQLKPHYPRDAQLRRLEGEVVVEFVVDADGTCGAIEVISSRPGRLFESSAVHAIERWRFSPGVSRGQPVPVRVRQRVAFTLP